MRPKGLESQALVLTHQEPPTNESNLLTITDTANPIAVTSLLRGPSGMGNEISINANQHTTTSSLGQDHSHAVAGNRMPASERGASPEVFYEAVEQQVSPKAMLPSTNSAQTSTQPASTEPLRGFGEANAKLDRLLEAARRKAVETKTAQQTAAEYQVLLQTMQRDLETSYEAKIRDLQLEVQNAEFKASDQLVKHDEEIMAYKGTVSSMRKQIGKLQSSLKRKSALIRTMQTQIAAFAEERQTLADVRAVLESFADENSSVEQQCQSEAGTDEQTEQQHHEAIIGNITQRNRAARAELLAARQDSQPNGNPYAPFEADEYVDQDPKRRRARRKAANPYTSFGARDYQPFPTSEARDDSEDFYI